MTYRTEIRDFLVDRFLFGNDSKITDTMSLVESGTIDSTGILELVAYVEERFSVSISDEEIVPEHFDSIAKLSTFIERKQGTVDLP